MKTKLEMAHEMALAIQGAKLLHDMELVSNMAWKYADAMQAEVDKREKKEQEKLEQDERNYHDELVFIGLEEWQPDWNQAPEWYNWWAMDEDRKCHWFSKEPNLVDGFSEWILGNNGEGLNNTYSPSINCGYTGDWRDSLRKRPN